MLCDCSWIFLICDFHMGRFSSTSSGEYSRVSTTELLDRQVSFEKCWHFLITLKFWFIWRHVCFVRQAKLLLLLFKNCNVRSSTTRTPPPPHCNVFFLLLACKNNVHLFIYDDLYKIVHLWSFNVWDEYVDHILITEKHKLPKQKSSTLFLDMI